MKKKYSNVLRLVACTLMAFLFGISGFAQVNSGAKYNKSNHKKQIIGYFTQWDAWKEQSGIVPKGGYNQLNIDYSQYTILNWSFVGVAEDGSLHSGDLRAKDIYRPEVKQKPGPMFWDDIYSSWDLWLLYGELQVIHYLADDLDKKPSDPLYWVWENYGYKGSSSGWVNTRTGDTGAYPVSVPKKGSQYKGLLDLAHANGTKVMLSIGGWSMCKHFPAVAADPAKRARFMRDCKKAIDMGFDGIDIDWEYPGKAGMNFEPTPGDYKNFTILMQEIRNTIGPDKLISAAFYAGTGPLKDLEWSKLNNIMNYYNFMTYDWGGAWNETPNHNSPLYDYPQSEWGAASWNTLYEGLKTFGVDMSKVVMGMAPYGRGVICKSNAALDVNVKTDKRPIMVEPDGPVTSAADTDNWKLTGGSPNYNEILKVFAAGGWTTHWDDNAQVPYATKGKYFLSYDDERSIGLKAQYINDKQLAGTIIWHVFGDMTQMTDQVQTVGNKFAYCPKTKPVLMNKINEVFATGNGGGGQRPNQPPTITITTPANGATVNTNTVNVIVTASDADGAVTKVEYYLNGSLKQTATSAPYSASISGLNSGSNTIMAKAFDNNNATATASASVTYSAAVENIPPVVEIITPASGTTVNTSSVNVTATASANGGTIVSKVEFYLNGALKTTKTASPYTASIGTLNSGSNIIMAKVTDSKGGTASANATVTYSTGGGITPPAGNSNIEKLLPKTLYEQMFPYRNGYNASTGVREGDFFSYDKLIEAVKQISNISSKFERRCATNAYRVTRIDKTTGAQTVIREDDDFKNSNAAIITETVDYGDFISYGSSDVQKRELMAFLANIAQETTGGWATAPGGQYAWGLHFKEEVGYTDNSNAYREEGHAIYPPAAGKSYHGRGPIQLSWNYNYGAMSEFLYGDKNILLKNPEKVTQDGAIAFQTAIWFWMTPQYPKVSCHDAITGIWKPTSTQLAQGLTAGFGATVNIINGGIECGSGREFEKVTHRIGHYDKFCKIANVSMAIDGSNSTIELGCANMKPFQINYQECAGLPGGGGDNGGGDNCGAAEWSASKEYNGGDKAYYKGFVYTASFWNKGSRPDQNFAPFGQPWNARVECGPTTGPGDGGGETPNIHPTVSITSPANGATVSTTSVSATAHAAATNASVTKVEFFLNGALKHTATSAPYTATLGTLNSGSNAIMAKVHDSKGQTAESTVNVTYNATVQNTPPTISITSPANATTTTATAVNVTTTAGATNATVSKVEFYLNGALKATKTTAPYTANVSTLNAGANSIMVKVTDSKGQTAESSINITYNAPTQNTPPTVSIVSPANGATVTTTAVDVVATAGATSATVSKVEFYLNGALKATKTTAPYTANLSTLNAGTNSIMAKVTDSKGQTAESSINMTYNTPGGGGGNSGDCMGVAVWTATKVYNTGDRARDGDIIYKANYWTQNNKPSANAGNGKPWTVVSKCDGSLDADAFGPTQVCGGQKILIWDSKAVYDKNGTKVVHEGKVYTSKYWTQGNIPGKSDPWTLVGPCN